MSIWDVIQNVQLGNTRARRPAGEWASNRAASGLREADLQERIARLELMTEAMWELMSERERLTISDFAHRVNAINGRDADGDRGGWDGVRLPEYRCSSCRAVIPVGTVKCQFCGTESIEARGFSA